MENFSKEILQEGTKLLRRDSTADSRWQKKRYNKLVDQQKLFYWKNREKRWKNNELCL